MPRRNRILEIVVPVLRSRRRRLPYFSINASIAIGSPVCSSGFGSSLGVQVQHKLQFEIRCKDICQFVPKYSLPNIEWSNRVKRAEGA